MAARRKLSARPRIRRACTQEARVEDEVSEDSLNVARLILLLTAACWATYPVAIKLLVIAAGKALDPALVTVIRFTLNACFGLFLLPQELLPWSRSRTGASAEPSLDVGALAFASFEISAWGIGGTLFNTWGIEHTSAIRAALLLSSINILTPLLSALIGSSPQDRTVSIRTWLGCVLAFVATAYATVDFTGDMAGRLGEGDLAILGSAFCYSTLKVRLASKARAFEGESLAAGRLIAGAVLSWVVFLTSYTFSGQTDWQNDILQLPTAAWTVLLLSSFIPGVVATVLQIRGQRVVPPAQAQTIYAAVPLFAGIYDVVFLADTLEQREVVAGVAILVAATLSATSDEN